MIKTIKIQFNLESNFLPVSKILVLASSSIDSHCKTNLDRVKRLSLTTCSISTRFVNETTGFGLRLPQVLKSTLLPLSLACNVSLQHVGSSVNSTDKTFKTTLLFGGRSMVHLQLDPMLWIILPAGFRITEPQGVSKDKNHDCYL